MPIFLLIDCNNFYASCHRIFNPRLEGQPVVVLSNNDGCIIARSNEAKKLGIPMGAPYFQYKKFCQDQKIAVFSSNYELYGDISQRIMTVLRSLCQSVEVYSIDEAFLCFDSESKIHFMDFCLMIRRKIKMWIGIPVSIGIGPSKTLAKAANLTAKRQNLNGVFDLRDSSLQNIILTELKTSDIWGVGQRLTSKLCQLGISNAQQLRDQPDEQIRRQFGVTLQRTLLELRGISCLGLENSKPRQNIISSRSFSRVITDLIDLETAVSRFIAIACSKLRKQGSKAQGMYIFIHTNLHNKKTKPYSNSIFCSFATPTLDTRLMIGAGKHHLRKIYLPGLGYKKAGIMLVNLIDSHICQEDLFIKNSLSNKNENLMHTLDQINKRLGRNSIFIAAEGTQNQHRQWSSPCFTTQWTDILTIKI